MPFFPLHDGARSRRSLTHPVTLALVAACTLVFLWQLTLGEAAEISLWIAYGATPAVVWGQAQLPPDIAAIPPELTLVTSLFLHGTLLHLVVNMLFLWNFGAKVEEALGHARFLAFYLASGVLAQLTDAFMRADSVVPVIGASGAISGLLGGFVLLHPRARLLLLLLFVIPVRMRAWVAILAWMAVQFAFALYGDPTSSIAWWAHIGGFFAGLALLLLLRPPDVKLFGHPPGPWGY